MIPDDMEPIERRVALQLAARETGERIGRQEARIEEHSAHFGKLNGSISDLAGAMAQQATSIAVLAVSVKNIEVLLENDTDETNRRKTISTQWLLAIVAAVVALIGIGVTIVLTLVVLYANGKL